MHIRIAGITYKDHSRLFEAVHMISPVHDRFVWLGGRVVRTLDLRSIGREFESWPLRYQVQPWASC